MVGRHELRCLLKGVSLFTFNAAIAALCELFGICISHTENVIGLNSLVGATVPWDWFAEGQSLLLVFDTEKDFVRSI